MPGLVLAGPRGAGDEEIGPAPRGARNGSRSSRAPGPKSLMMWS